MTGPQRRNNGPGIAGHCRLPLSRPFPLSGPDAGQLLEFGKDFFGGNPFFFFGKRLQIRGGKRTFYLRVDGLEVIALLDSKGPDRVVRSVAHNIPSLDLF